MTGDPRDQEDAHRHEPYDIDVEQALLGSFLADSNAYWRAAEILTPDHFYDPLHARIYDTIGRLCARDERVTPLTLHAAMKADPGLMEMEGMKYLAKLAAAAPALPNIKEYAGILRSLAVRRGIIAASRAALEAAYSPPEETTAEQIAERAGEALYEATQNSKADEGAQTIQSLAMRAALMAETAMNAPAGVCLTSGLWLVDERLGGVYRGDLTILGGPPNSGKTALAEHIGMANAAKENAEEVLFFSLEMVAHQIATRELAARARVPSDVLRRGKTTPHEMELVAMAAREFPDLPYRVDGSRRLSVAQMRARAQARKRRSKTGLALVLIDNLRLIKPLRPRDDEKDQLQQITSDLKDMAAELNVAILCISHITRDYAKRSTTRPQLSDLYGSSAIEQNADAVWFVHREIYFLERNPPTGGGEAEIKWMAACDREKGWAEIFAAKQRMGPIGQARVKFDEQFTQYSDPEPQPTQTEIGLWQALNDPGRG